MRRNLILPGILVSASVLVGAGCFPYRPPGELHAEPFLVCTRAHESDRDDVNGNGLHDGGYQAYNAAGPYKGAYQFLQGTWDATAHHGGYPWLAGVDPRHATDDEQDVMAWELFLWQGKAPWGYRC